MGDEVKHSADNKVHIIVNKGHTGVQHTGDTLDITVQGEYSGSKAPSATAVLHNMGDDGFTVPPLPNSKSVLYNYIMDYTEESYTRMVFGVISQNFALFRKPLLYFANRCVISQTVWLFRKSLHNFEWFSDTCFIILKLEYGYMYKQS